MNEEWYIRAQDYLTGNMTADEKAVFEQECAQNPEWAAALEQERQLKAVVEVDEYLRMKKMLAEADQEAMVIPARSWLTRWRAVAASLILFANLLFFLLRPSFPVRLSNHLYYHPSSSELTSDRKGTGTAKYPSISEAYDKGNWESALQMAKQALLTDSDNLVLQNMIAHCYYQMKDFESAEREFSKSVIMAQGNTVEHNKALFYQAMALLKLNKPENAKEKLQLIDGPYLPIGTERVDIEALIQQLD